MFAVCSCGTSRMYTYSHVSHSRARIQTDLHLRLLYLCECVMRGEALRIKWITAWHVNIDHHLVSHSNIQKCSNSDRQKVWTVYLFTFVCTFGEQRKTVSCLRPVAVSHSSFFVRFFVFFSLLFFHLFVSRYLYTNLFIRGLYCL